MDPSTLTSARAHLMDEARALFQSYEAVRAIWVSGSIASGRADAYSDIDLRVAVRPEAHAWFVGNRRVFPQSWSGFAFNEWVPGTQHCVSHFRPFLKIDIFYFSLETLEPSVWHARPMRILYDPDDVLRQLAQQSVGLREAPPGDKINRLISKGLAAVHEAYRRVQRGDLLYAQSLLDELRHFMMMADDLLHGRTPDADVYVRFSDRGTPNIVDALQLSYCRCVRGEILKSMHALAMVHRGQIIELHKDFKPDRSLAIDLESIDVVTRELPLQ